MGNFLKILWSWLKEIIIVVIVALIFNFFFVVSTVYNVSMYPTLEDGDIVLLSRFGEINRGDIVSFKSVLTITDADVRSLNFLQRLFNKAGDRKNLIKRVIAGPGDTVEIAGGRVYLNGGLLTEPYVKEFFKEKDFPETKLPADSYFVVGDNRPHSFDGRDFGFVRREDIIGKVLFRFWPLNKLGKP